MNNKYKCGGSSRRRANYGIQRGGYGIPIEGNTYLLRGRSHSNGGIDIGKHVEAQGGEVVRQFDKNGNNVQILSKENDFVFGSPAKNYLSGKMSFNQAFAMQQMENAMRGRGDFKRKMEDGGKSMVGVPATDAERRALSMGMFPNNIITTFIPNIEKKYWKVTDNFIRTRLTDEDKKLLEAEERYNDVAHMYNNHINVSTDSPKSKQISHKIQKALSKKYKAHINPNSINSDYNNIYDPSITTVSYLLNTIRRNPTVENINSRIYKNGGTSIPTEYDRIRADWGDDIKDFLFGKPTHKEGVVTVKNPVRDRLSIAKKNLGNAAGTVLKYMDKAMSAPDTIAKKVTTKTRKDLNNKIAFASGIAKGLGMNNVANKAMAYVKQSENTKSNKSNDIAMGYPGMALFDLYNQGVSNVKDNDYRNMLAVAPMIVPGGKGRRGRPKKVTAGQPELSFKKTYNAPKANSIDFKITKETANNLLDNELRNKGRIIVDKNGNPINLLDQIRTTIRKNDIVKQIQSITNGTPQLLLPKPKIKGTGTKPYTRPIIDSREVGFPVTDKGLYNIRGKKYSAPESKVGIPSSIYRSIPLERYLGTERPFNISSDRFRGKTQPTGKLPAAYEDYLLNNPEEFESVFGKFEEPSKKTITARNKKLKEDYKAKEVAREVAREEEIARRKQVLKELGVNKKSNIFNSLIDYIDKKDKEWKEYVNYSKGRDEAIHADGDTEWTSPTLFYGKGKNRTIGGRDYYALRKGKNGKYYEFYGTTNNHNLYEVYRGMNRGANKTADTPNSITTANGRVLTKKRDIVRELRRRNNNNVDRTSANNNNANNNINNNSAKWYRNPITWAKNDWRNASTLGKIWRGASAGIGATALGTLLSGMIDDREGDYDNVSSDAYKLGGSGRRYRNRFLYGGLNKGRKKAGIGADLAEYPMISPVDAIKVNMNPYEYFKYGDKNEKGDITKFPKLNSEYVNAGINLLGAGAGALINNYYLNRMRFNEQPAIPIATRGNINYNINPQLAENNFALRLGLDENRSNTMSSQNFRNAATQAAITNAITNNKLWAEKNNKENEMYNAYAERQTRANIAGSEAYNQFALAKQKFENDRLEKKSENWINAINTIPTVVNNINDNRQKNIRYRNDAAISILPHLNNLNISNMEKTKLYNKIINDLYKSTIKPY